MYLALNDDEWIGNYKYFTEQEMTCKCKCGLLPKHSFMISLDDLREEVGFPLPVTGGARCPTHNNRVSTTGVNGPHTLQVASDIRVYGERAYILLKTALKLGFTGIGINQKGTLYSRYLHLDKVTNNRPRIWSY